MSRRVWALLLLALLPACAAHEKAIAQYEQSYKSDTLLLNRLLQPLGVEPPHGQVTVSVTKRFAEKMLRASLQPNLLTMSVAGAGLAWRQQVTKLRIEFDNRVWLNDGQVQLGFDAQKLELAGDVITLLGSCEGHGTINADLKFFGVPLKRQVEVWTRFADPLAMHLEQAPAGWVLRLVGAPLKLHVEVSLPAFTVAGTDMLPVKFARDVEFPLDKLQPFALPLPTPRVVKMGPTEVSLGLEHFALGAHDGLLWLGADMVVGDAQPAQPAPPAPSAPAPATPPAPAPPKTAAL